MIFGVCAQNKIGAGRLMGPKGIAVDRNGHIIAVDNKACCVFIFQSNGKLVTRFGARGSLDRQFAGTDVKHSGAAQHHMFVQFSACINVALGDFGVIFTPAFLMILTFAVMIVCSNSQPNSQTILKCI